MKKLDILVLILLVIGGINWGLWGILDFNIIEYFFKEEWIRRVLYFIIGVAGIYVVFSWKGLFIKKKGK